MQTLEDTALRYGNDETKLLKTDPTDARKAGSIQSIPFREFDTKNNNKVLLLPGAQQNTATIISENIYAALKWPERAKKHREWVRPIATYLKQYDS